MKITRLKKGYRIAVTDTEFEALSFLVMHGQGDMEGVDPKKEHGLHGRVARLLTDGRFGEHRAMRIDEDRR